MVKLGPLVNAKKLPGVRLREYWVLFVAFGSRDPRYYINPGMLLEHPQRAQEQRRCPVLLLLTLLNCRRLSLTLRGTSELRTRLV